MRWVGFLKLPLTIHFSGHMGSRLELRLEVGGLSSLLPALMGSDGVREEHFLGEACSVGSQCIFLWETWKGYCKVLAAAWNDLGRTGPQTAWQEPEALFFSSPALPCGSSCQGIPRMSGFCPFVCFSSICHWIIFIHLWLFHTRNLGICLFLDIKGGGGWRHSHQFVPPFCDGARHHGPGLLGLAAPTLENSCMSELKFCTWEWSTLKPQVLEMWAILCATLFLFSDKL